jgi:N-acetylmuramoyl-L-alanine amidase
MFKLALNAGHYLYTAGKRCHPSLDPNQTREWTLNNRVADKIEKILAEYDGIEVLRIDDRTGQTDVSLKDRTDKANNWGADFWLSIHHNAAGKVFSGGGIVAYVYTNATQTEVEWQHALYRAAVQSTGLYGNRSNAVPKKDLHELRETKCPAVIMECGFMDSSADVPVILTEEYASKLASALADVVIAKSGAVKREERKPLYLLQLGPFKTLEEAESFKSILLGGTVTAA